MACRLKALGHGGGERDDVVLDLALDFQNAIDVEGGVLAQRPRGLLRHFAELGESFSGGQLDLEPGLELIGIAPDPAHFRARITCNHTVRTL